MGKVVRYINRVTPCIFLLSSFSFSSIWHYFFSLPYRTYNNGGSQDSSTSRKTPTCFQRTSSCTTDLAPLPNPTGPSPTTATGPSRKPAEDTSNRSVEELGQRVTIKARENDRRKIIWILRNYAVPTRGRLRASDNFYSCQWI
ncbi:uncharacterized protein BDV17DRAFT_274159 [Aspergillus undulatus]|uniref:uncharacterized protein n=1 Tax=Aspergillus undulatus TaxID=1810928 RepID=UPI003CCCFA23